MSEPWKLVNFNRGATPFGSRLRIYAGERVLLSEGHAISREVLEGIVIDHNGMAQARETLVLAKTEMEAMGSLLLEVQQESATLHRLLEKIVHSDFPSVEWARAMQAASDHLRQLGKSQSPLVIEHATVYDYNRHGVMAFQAPDFQNDEALQLQQLAEAHTPLTIYLYQETTR